MDLDIKELLFQVVTSWQVIFITVALVFYIFIVNKIMRSRGRRSRSSPGPKVAVKKNDAGAPLPEPSGDNDLGLEEEGEEE